MKIIKTKEIPAFIAGDQTILKELLNAKTEKTIRYSLAHAVVKAGETSVPHQLSGSEIYYILSGSGIMTIDEESENVEVGDVVVIPPKATQFIKNTGADDLVFLAICDPSWHEQSELV